MTPKRPEATCLIAERIESPLGNGLKRCASSPPSPVLDLPPMRFIAMASVVCASRLIEPKLIAPVANRLTICARRLDLVERHRFIGEFERHQPADRQVPLALLVDRRRKGPVIGERVAAHRMLQFGDRLRRPGMVLAAQSKGVIAAEIEHVLVERVVAISVLVPRDRLLRDLAQPHAFDRRRRAGEVFLDKIAGETDGVEDLRPAIGLVGRDPHLGDDFEDPLADRLDVVLLHLFGAERQIVLDAHLLERGKGEIGVDRLRAVAGQRTEMMHLARLAGLDDDAGQGAQTLADQVMVHRRCREQSRDRHPLGRSRAVGQDQDVVPGFHRQGRLIAQPLERRAPCRPRPRPPPRSCRAYRCGRR